MEKLCHKTEQADDVNAAVVRPCGLGFQKESREWEEMEAETSGTTRTLVAGAVGNRAGPGKWVRSWGVALGLLQLA